MRLGNHYTSFSHGCVRLGNHYTSFSHGCVRLGNHYTSFSHGCVRLGNHKTSFSHRYIVIYEIRKSLYENEEEWVEFKITYRVSVIDMSD